jgi:TIR domain
MKVFISWSGERSHELGRALHDFLPLVLHYVEPWLSQADIEAGQRWADQVAKELEACNFGILCVTKENVSSPWVLFEAGALAKSMQGSRVIPLLLDLEFRDITGPLAQFQAKKIDRTGLFEVVQSLNQIGQHPVPDDRVKQLFDALWPELERKVLAIPKTSAQAKHARPQPEILEELVTSVRTLDGRFRELAEDGPRSVRHRSRRLHPMMVRELSHLLGTKRGDPIGLLVLASMFREDMPWMYELGLEAYRMAKDGNSEEALAARVRFQQAANFMRKGPFGSEEFGFDPHMLHMMVRELDSFLDLDEDADSRSKDDPAEAAERSHSMLKRMDTERLIRRKILKPDA